MWRFSRAEAWRIRFRILSGAVSIVLLLSIPRAALHAEGQVRIGYDDYWYYHGEVEPKPAVATSCNGIPCRQICDEALCAHGTGSYGTDGGQSYVGEFRHGWMHGHGEYSSDFVSYVGGFKNGAFDGDGVLECPDVVAVTVKGRFTEGFMDGPFEVNGEMKTYSHVPVGPVLPPDKGFSKGLDYASVAICPD